MRTTLPRFHTRLREALRQGKEHPRRVTGAGQPENVDRLHDDAGGRRARLHIGHVGVHMGPREENQEDQERGPRLVFQKETGFVAVLEEEGQGGEHGERDDSQQNAREHGHADGLDDGRRVVGVVGVFVVSTAYEHVGGQSREQQQQQRFVEQAAVRGRHAEVHRLRQFRAEGVARPGQDDDRRRPAAATSAVLALAPSSEVRLGTFRYARPVSRLRTTRSRPGPRRICYSLVSQTGRLKTCFYSRRAGNLTNRRRRRLERDENERRARILSALLGFKSVGFEFATISKNQSYRPPGDV